VFDVIGRMQANPMRALQDTCQAVLIILNAAHMMLAIDFANA
jgi:hypothetical protein